MSWRFPVAALCGICTVVSGWSAAATPEEVIVTATRTRTPADQLAVPVLVIDRHEIEASLAADTADLLAGHAGIEVARTGGPGQIASLFLRGTDSNHATVLIDGVRVNPGTIGGAPLQNVLPESLERIEVVKGARSTLYGSDAIGGVINLITRSGAERGLNIGASSGRYGTESLYIDGGADFGGRVSVAGDVAWRRSNGLPPFADSTQNRGYDNLSGDARLRFRPNDATSLGLRAWQATGNTQYLDYDHSTPLDEDYRNQLYSADASWQRDGLELSATASHWLDDLRQQQTADFVRTRRDALDTQLDIAAGARQQLTIGAVLSRELTDSLSFGTGFDVQRRTQLYYAQDQLRLPAGALLLAVGTTHDSHFGNHQSWNAEYALPLGAGWQFSAATGSGYHAPDSTDLYGFGGNPQLRPEQSRQIEAGLRWLSGDAARNFSLQAFDNRVRDLILAELIDPENFLYRNANVERARIRGVELEYGIGGASWQADASLTLQEPRNESNDTQLLRRARQYASLNLTRQAGGWSLGGNLHYSGPRLDAGFPDSVRLRGYTLLGLTASTEIAGRWTVAARVDNLTDERYELVSGYNTPGRAVTLAVRYRLR